MPDIFSYITTEESNYENPIILPDGSSWSMKEHIRLSSLYNNSQLSTGKDDMKPVKNITRPILNLQYRSEGFDVKDIELFINEYKNYYKSFLVRKFHDKWARQNDMDTFIDDVVESYVLFGGVLVKNVNSVRPEVVPMQSIAFCDQTNILNRPIGFKHDYTPDELLDMVDNGWGKTENGATDTIENLIEVADNSKTPNSQTGIKNKTPGKNIEVYEVHGTFPTSFLKDDLLPEEKKYTRQIQIVAFYTTKEGKRSGVILYRKENKKQQLKFLSRDKIYSRGLGFGGAEELFEAQVWTNYDMIRMKEMLDAASKIILKTTDPTFAQRHPTGLKDMDNLEVVEVQQGSDIGQMDTFPRNLALFERAAQNWESHGQQIASAGEATIMGTKNAPSGTPFASLQLSNQEAHGTHDYRKGKIATFLSEIYRDWTIPYFVDEVTKGQEFLSELSFDELQQISEYLVQCEVEKLKNKLVLNGELPPDQQQEEIFKQKVRKEFLSGGSKRFIEIFKGEMKKAKVDVWVNITDKQKNMPVMVEKLTNIFRQVFANPQILTQYPFMAKTFNEILEASGLSPMDFAQSQLTNAPQPQQPVPSPIAPTYSNVSINK